MSLIIKGRRWPWVVGIAVASLVALAGICEAAGWPFLVGPLQRWVSQTIDRRVAFASGADRGVRIGLLGSVRVTAATIEIGAPTWSKEPHMVLAQNAILKLGYGDIWRAYRGKPLHIRELRAAKLDARVEREADGRATWQFGKPKDEDPARPARFPSFGDLRVADGTLVFRDAILAANLDARFSLTEHNGAAGASSGAGGSSPASGAASGPASAKAASAEAASAPSARAASAVSGPASGPSSLASGLQFSANGTYRKLPLKVELITSSIAGLVGTKADEVVQPVTLDATVGHATLVFRGTASDPLHLTGLRGAFRVEGPSLAAVGDALGITLPTTGRFKTDGYLTKDEDLWKAVFDRATIGDSRLGGSFTFDRGRPVPLLSGRLTGSQLLLRDLGPVVGAAPRSATEAEKRVAATVGKKKAAPSAAALPGKGGRVLPDRHFDLPSLRAMDANVLIDIAHFELGTELLEPLEPLHAHLRVGGGVLTISDLDARTAQGRLTGELELDGRKPQALWRTDLRLLGVRLERWLHQARNKAAPPYITGQLDGQVKVSGKGRSTAEILGSLEGGIRFHLRNGSVSHLLVEAAGIDVAQALGMLIKGDESLVIQCNVVDLVVQKGVARPTLFVIDTSDSTLWFDGTVSLQNEALDLRAIVSPKDFSPLTLRSPVHVKGTFSNPSVSLEAGKLGAKVGAAALLSLLNPLAAIIPFIDPGARDEAQRAAAQCAALAQRGNPARIGPSGTAALARRP